ncbi:DNA topoisomerase [Naematelia encephala]|uniref:DNA topoisomerase n=1 Tax=Naematelia encephala TaxID=71784 RepID=A0A1Y2B848_9TREE|nr:DNA topoisomerase [Naematelia encephala]
MRVLCVAEKPSIAKSITQILSGGRWDSRESGHKYIRNYDFPYRLPPPLGGNGDADFTVTAVLGHLTSQDFNDDYRKWHSCDPFALFEAPLVTFINKDLKKVETNLQREARNSDLLMIWTDCDREGEHIGSEVAAVCRKSNRNLRVKRARFSAIIPAQIHQACQSANDLDMRQADAVEARIALDLRIGAAFTRLTTMTLQSRVAALADQLVSYGPCQFPTLGFVVDQYKRVSSFIPETFWYIYVAIEREDEDDESAKPETRTVEFRWKRNHLFDLETAVVLYEQCVENPRAKVVSVETKPTTKWKPLPLTTVELQQTGSRLLHMAPKRVLDLAEKLYQKGFLSYPRTETDQFDKDFDFNSLIQKQTADRDWGAYAQKLLDGDFQRPRNGKKNDKAHPPIHPTAHASNLDNDERRVFELVTRRFLASCSSNAEGKTTTVEIEIAGEYFSTSGLVVLSRNYLEVYPYDKWASSAVPDFQEDEEFMPTVCELREGTTTRPNLLTEADLVGLMDKNGIGTDATIAEHIAKIIEREYVKEKQEQKVKYLVPSPLGVGLVEGYNSIGFDRSLSKPHLRRETEHRMQLICDGVQSKADVLAFSIEQYKEVFVKAKTEFTTIVENVDKYLHGQGEEQDALRAANRTGRGRGAARGATRGARGGRGGRGGGAGGVRPGADDDDDEDDDDENGPDGEGGGGRLTLPSTSRRGTTTKTTRGRGRGRGAATSSERPKPAQGRKRKQDDSPAPAVDTPVCTCGDEAVMRTSQSGANPGRKFWTCKKPREESCGFFDWADDNGPITRDGPSRPSSRQVAPPTKAPRASTGEGRSARDEEGTMRCACGLEASNATVNKDGPNKGRRFWGCPNGVRARCGFFLWEDEEDEGTGPRAKSSRPINDGGGSGAGECFKCGESGHWSNACPNDASERPFKKQRGTKSSTVRGGGGAGKAGKAGSSDACYKCQQPGHWASACPNEESGSRAAPGRNNGRSIAVSGECYKCQKSGHWAKDCPNERPDSSGAGYASSARRR